MGSAALGSIGFAFEPAATPGEQDGYFLAYGAVVATSSAANQPAGSSGMRAHIRVYNNTATGTVTVAGKDINGNAISETSPTIPIYNNAALTQEQGAWDYETQAVYGSINASGITTTGLTNGFMKIGALPGARYLMPATAKITPKYGEFSPEEHRALPDLHTHKTQTVKDVDIQFDTALYPDESLWAAYALVNSTTNPSTPTTSPASATSLLAATAVSGSPLSLTTQPTAPGMKLILTIASSTVPGTVAITGVDAFTGETDTESIYFSGNGTLYSSNVYKSVNASGIVVTGLTSGTLAISGVYGWNRTFLPSLTPLTVTTEWFTGTDSISVPYCSFSELSLDFDVEKEFKLAAKGIGQDYIPIGDRTVNPMTASRVVNLAQPTDAPLAVWSGQVYIDPLSNSPGTTLFGDLLTGKITIKNPLKPVHKMNNRQTLSIVYRKKISIEFEGKIDYTNVLQLEQFRQDLKQYVMLKFYGRQVGGGNVQEIDFIIPFKFHKFEVTSTPSMEYAEATIAGVGEYDPGIGGSYKVNWLNSVMPPNYSNS